MEIPTKFCPKPPVITYKRLLDDNNQIIFEFLLTFLFDCGFLNYPCYLNSIK